MKSFKQYIAEEPIPMDFGKGGVIPAKEKKEEEKEEENTEPNSKKMKFGKGGVIPDKDKNIIPSKD